MEYDLHNSINAVMALKEAAIATDTTTVCEIIDTKDFDSLEYIISSGTITDGAYALKLEEGDDAALADAADVPAADILGDLVGFALADDDTVKRVGSIGKKRYSRLSIVSTETTTGADSIGAVAVQGNPRSKPVANY